MSTEETKPETEADTSTEIEAEVSSVSESEISEDVTEALIEGPDETTAMEITTLEEDAEATESELADLEASDEEMDEEVMETEIESISEGGEEPLGAKHILAKTEDGKELKANLISKDIHNDIAILKINLDTIHLQAEMFFGDSSKMKEGDKVFTIGYPLSNILGQKARYTEGVINSIYGIHDDPTRFQISVPIQPGNSGGDLP